MRSLFRLRMFLRPYWRQGCIALILLLFMTAIQLVFPEIIRRVIDIGLLRGEIQYLVTAGLVILALGFLRGLTAFWQRYLSAWVAHKVSYDLRNQLYDHIQHLSFSFHDHSQTGQLISRCIEDVRSTNRFTGFGLVELLKICILIFGITILLFLTNAQLAVIALIPMIPLILITTRFGKRISKLFYIVDQALGELSARLQENVTGAQVVRAFAREPYEILRFDMANRELYDTRINVFAEFAKIFPTTHLLVTLGTILILWFGGGMVLRGEMTIGEIVAFNAYLLLMATPAQQLAWTVNLAGEAAAGIDRIFEILDREPQIKSPSHAHHLSTLSGHITFQNVYFRYQGETTYALKNIQLEVQPNQIVALIGPTGAGKTSLVNLIPRFYDVERGAVQVDRHDVREVDLISLRKQIGIVLQSSLLFSDTIRENIAFGSPDATQEAIISAAKAAQAHDFITSMTDGYDTVVGERGITLSGGQRQRVAIARAILMDPRILILDDSTSSVDTETEHLIQSALNQLMMGRTTFVIAHRLSTVRRADVILVMEDGKIIERGKHDELLAQKGLYREIYELQLSDQEEAALDIKVSTD